MLLAVCLLCFSFGFRADGCLLLLILPFVGFCVSSCAICLCFWLFAFSVLGFVEFWCCVSQAVCFFAVLLDWRFVRLVVFVCVTCRRPKVGAAWGLRRARECREPSGTAQFAAKKRKQKNITSDNDNKTARNQTLLPGKYNYGV